MYYIVRHLSIFYRPPSVCVIYSSATYVSTRGFSTEEGQAFYLDFIAILFRFNRADRLDIWWLWWWWRWWRLFRNRCRCQKEVFELFYPSEGIFHQVEETLNKKIKRALNELVESFQRTSWCSSRSVFASLTIGSLGLILLRRTGRQRNRTVRVVFSTVLTTPILQETLLY